MANDELAVIHQKCMDYYATHLLRFEPNEDNWCGKVYGGQKNLQEHHISKSWVGFCKRCDRKRRINFHHIVPRAYGGEDNKENIINLCQSCHDLVEKYTDLLFKNGKMHSPDELRTFIYNGFPFDEYWEEIEK